MPQRTVESKINYVPSSNNNNNHHSGSVCGKGNENKIEIENEIYNAKNSEEEIKEEEMWCENDVLLEGFEKIEEVVKVDFEIEQKQVEEEVEVDAESKKNRAHN